MYLRYLLDNIDNNAITFGIITTYNRVDYIMYRMDFPYLILIEEDGLL